MLAEAKLGTGLGGILAGMTNLQKSTNQCRLVKNSKQTFWSFYVCVDFWAR
jgi:hypothetical protein